MFAPAVPADLVAGKYRLTRMLGRGGMGSVWEGVHVTLGTRVACKFIEAEYAGSKEARDRFENEARAAAALRSKHVVEVYDHGVMADGRPYIVMEFLQGEPLDSRIERRGALTVAETARILQQVARALGKAHAQGIVHRDLKPENIFLVWDEEDQADIAKVVDFGIAKFTNDSLGISSQTRTGSILGTPFYMSPEQARGLRSVDARSDLWSLGVIGFQCMTGQVPFNGEALGDLLVKICTGDPPVPSSLRPELGPEVDAWVRRALAREPEQRFQSAREMADALSAAAGEPVRSPQASTFADESTVGPGPRAPGLSNTAGALTNAALTRSTPSANPPLANKSLLFGLAGGALLVVGGVVAVLVGTGGGAGDVAPEPAVAAAPAESPAAPEKAPDPEPAKEPVSDAKKPAEDQPPEAKDAKAAEPAEGKGSEVSDSKAPVAADPKPATTASPTPKVTRPKTEPKKDPAPSTPPTRKPGPVDLGY